MKKFKHFMKSRFFPALMSGLVLFMMALMAVVPVAVMTGCTPAQIATFDNTINTIQAHLPQITLMATGITALVAPEYAPLIAPGAGIIAADLNLIKSLVDDYKATQDASLLAKIDSYYQDIQSHLGTIVAAVGFKNPTSTAAVNLFAGAAGELLQFIQDLVTKQPAATAQMIRVKMPHVFGGSMIGLHAIAYSTGDAEADVVLSEMGAVQPIEIVNRPCEPNHPSDFGECQTEVASTSPVKAKKHTIHSTRQIAKTWNVLARNAPHVKLSVPRARFIGVPVPFTGH